MGEVHEGLFGDPLKLRLETEDFLAKAKDGGVINSEEWPPLALFSRTPTYQKIMGISEGVVVGSFVPAILNPNFLAVFSRKVDSLDPHRCSDLDLMTTKNLKSLAEKFMDKGFIVERYNEEALPWESSSGRELYEAPWIKIIKDELVLATVFRVANEAAVRDWLRQRAFSDEKVGLKFENGLKQVRLIDPNGLLEKGDYWLRTLAPGNKYLLPENNSYKRLIDILTKIEKFAPRVAEQSQIVTQQTGTYITELLDRYWQEKPKMDKEEITDFERRVARAISRTFAVDPLKAVSWLILRIPILGIFSPTLVEHFGWRIQPFSMMIDQKYNKRQGELINLLQEKFGFLQIGDRGFPQFIITLPKRYPKSMREVMDIILSLIEGGTRSKIMKELNDNWPREVNLGSRWIPRDAPLDFNPAIYGV